MESPTRSVSTVVPSVPAQQLFHVPPRQYLRGSVRAARCLSLFSALKVRLEDASVWGVLDTDWLWLFLKAPSLLLSREFPETALTLDCGRCCEFTELAVGGGMGEGSRRLLLVLETEGCV